MFDTAIPDKASDAHAQLYKTTERSEPAINAVSYSRLLEINDQQYGDSRKTKDDRRAIRTWLDFLGESLDSAIADEFEAEFVAQTNRFIEYVATSRTPKTAHNLAACIRHLQRIHTREKLNNDLPPGLSDAIQVALSRKGLRVRDVWSKKRLQSVVEWATGKSIPRNTEANQERIRQMEDKLDIPRGELAKRAWPVRPAQVIHLSDDVPHRRYQKIVSAHKFALNVADMPDRLRAGIEALIEHKKQTEHFLPTGLVQMDIPHLWNSDETVKMRIHSLQRFFGWLLLPKQPAGALEKDWAKAIRYGHGLALDDLRITMLVQQDLWVGHMKYAMLRTFDREHFLHYEATQVALKEGNIPPPPSELRKTVPASFEVTMTTVISLVNKPTSFLRMRPEYGQELSPPVPPEAWEAWCISRAAELLVVLKAAKTKIEYNKRSNKRVLSDVLRLDDPRSAVFDMLDAMRRDLPPITQMVLRARAYRDLTVLSLLNFECIRGKNICLLDIGRHIIEGKNGVLRLFIPKHEMKNNIWGHAEDIDREFPPDLNKLLNTWINEYRPLFKGHALTKALFMSCQTCPVIKPDTDPYRMTTQTVFRVTNSLTKRYFGVGVGPHAFRNINSTSVVRMGGTIGQVKASLNDSAKTATDVYLDVQNSDEYKGLTALYERSRQRLGAA